MPGAMRLPRYGHPEREFSFGFPAGTAYACMSETMILALEERCESFTLGKEVQIAKVDEISLLAQRHGFALSGYRAL